MSKFNFQFHALREETANYIAQKISEFSLTFVTTNFFPFEYKVYNSQEVTTDIITNSSEVLLMQREPIIDSTKRIEFLRENIGFLCVALGKQDDVTLYESQISGEADDEELKLWKNIISHYKKKMCKGAWVIGGSGAKRYDSTHWYTPAVKEGYKQGWTIRASSGASIYEFND